MKSDEAMHSATSLPSTETEVVVVGAGPTGLTAASELLRRGLRVRLIDEKAGPATTSRALATHARSLEIFDQMGLLDELLTRGRRVRAFTYYGPGGTGSRIELDFGALSTRFDFMLNTDQVHTEEVLRRRVTALGGRVEWNVRLEALSQDDKKVHATLLHQDGTRESVHAQWLIGCDGGHSTVRKILGIPLEGDTTQTWLIADARVRTDLAADSIHWMYPTGGAVMLFPFPEPDKWRLLDTVDISYGGDDQTVAARFTDKLTQVLGRPVQVELPTWVSVFTIQQRAARRLQVGRCLVAGDAAHVHSPASGQGMNCGIQDAYNLAWKLAAVCTGQASPELLGTYEAERVPIGQALLSSTREVTSVVMDRSSDAIAQADPVPFSQRLIRNMSGLLISYARSPLTAAANEVQEQRPAPGERVTQVRASEAQTSGWGELLTELRDPRWTLLVFAEQAGTPELTEQLAITAQAQAQYGAWLSVRTVTSGPVLAMEPIRTMEDPDQSLHRILNARAGSWMLIRPDGYLCSRGDRLPPVAALVPRFFRL